MHLLSWLFADDKLISELLEAIEVALDVVLGQLEGKRLEDADLLVFVVETGSELDSCLLSHDLGCTTLVMVIVEPWQALLEARVIEVRVGEFSIVFVLNKLFVEFTGLSALVVQLENADVCQSLTVFGPLPLFAADCRLEVVVVD